MTDDRKALPAGTQEKSDVALSSVLAAVALTGTKAVVGVMTGSLGILSEAAHSGLDLVAAAVTYLAVRVSGKPADREHTYGHGKIENLSALLETVLLLITCVWIIYEALHRLFFREQTVEVNVWSFLVILLSIVVDSTRSRALMNAAKKYGSQALEADALHFSTDIWSSCVVLLGLVCVLAAPRLGAHWLVKADSLAALGVAGIVVWVSVQLGRKTIDDLLDAVPPGLRDTLADAAARVPGVHSVRGLRVRRAGPEIFADIVVAVPRGAAFEQAHDIADAVEASVRAVVPGADVVVHTEPVEGRETPEASVKLLASRRGMAAHNVTLCREEDGVSLEFHAEVDDGLSVAAAHEQVEALERELHERLPDLSRITTHIEPRQASCLRVGARPAVAEMIRSALRELAGEAGLAEEPHDLRIQYDREGLTVSFHCAMAADLSIREAHTATERLEQELRRKVPSVRKAVIHVEPKQ
jgi:cation diffusion facilitator family transporter